MTDRPPACQCIGPFVIEDDAGPRCLKCGRQPAEPCRCRSKARSPRVDRPDICRTCRREIEPAEVTNELTGGGEAVERKAA